MVARWEVTCWGCERTAASVDVAGDSAPLERYRRARCSVCGGGFRFEFAGEYGMTVPPAVEEVPTPGPCCVDCRAPLNPLGSGRANGSGRCRKCWSRAYYRTYPGVREKQLARQAAWRQRQAAAKTGREARCG